MIPVLIEAALRALIVALAVGTGLRLLRVRNVLAQKVAWGLVLAASLAMPMVMRWHWLPASMQIQLARPAWMLPAEKHQTEMHPAEMPAAPVAAYSNPQSAPPLDLSESTPPVAPAMKLAAERAELRPGGNRHPAPAISSGGYSAPVHAQAFEAETPVSLWNKAVAAVGRVGRTRPGIMIALGYVTICCLLLLRLLYGLAIATDLWLAAVPIEPGMIANIAAGAHLRRSQAVFSPVTIGSGIVLPEDFAEWDAEKLRIVVAHERSHIRQGDFYLQMLAGVYAAIFWFSPLGWWLKRQLSDLGEAISDRAGLQEAASRASYAQVLLEFAAMPRPTLTGVAMARTSNLSHRIERLLNDTIFRQSFAASRRALLVGLFFPLALVAATSMIRVEAVGQTPPPAPPSVQAPAPAPAPAAPEAPLAGVSNPDAIPAPAPLPAPPSAPDMAPPAPPAPPAPGSYREIRDRADGYSYSASESQEDSVTNTDTTGKDGKHSTTSVGRGYSYSYSSNGDSWAVVTGPDQHINFSGEWNSSTREAIEKARKLSNGKFLWFTHNGKSYLIDDPAVVAQIQAMYQPMQELGRKQEELGRQQAKLGQEEAELGRQQAQERVPAPDLSREIAQVDAAVAKLKADKDAKVSQEELAEVQAKLAELQGRLGEMQGRIGDRMGALGEKQGHLGELQGKLGEQQGKLGEQQGKLAQEADRKVKSIIDNSLSSGKAKPVE